MIVIISKSPYFNTIALANRLVRQKLERESASCGLLFLGGITDSRKFIGHCSETESNWLLQPTLHGVSQSST